MLFRSPGISRFVFGIVPRSITVQTSLWCKYALIVSSEPCDHCSILPLSLQAPSLNVIQATKVLSGLAVIQTKSSLTGNPIADRAVDLWRAFTNWINAVEAGQLSVEDTIFCIHVFRLSLATSWRVSSWQRLPSLQRTR